MIIWIAAVVFVTYVVWFPFHKNPLYQDQSLNYYVGRQWFKGKIPGKDYAMAPGPFLYFFYGISSLVAKDNEVLFHCLSATYVALGNVFLFLATNLVYGLEAALAASILFAFYIFSPRLIGDRFPPEVYMTTPCIAGLFFLFRNLQEPTVVNALLCGLALSIGTLMRQGAYLYVPVMLFVMTLGSTVYSAATFLIGFSIFHLFWIAYFVRKKVLQQYLKRTLWNPIMLVLFANPEGPGRGKVDRMKVSGERMIRLIVGNSLTILPLYLLAISYVAYSVINSRGMETVAVVLLFAAAISLIFPRRNFDCCYWLNSVPWAAVLAGNGLAELCRSFDYPLDIYHCTTIVLLIGLMAYVVTFDYPMYVTLDPEKKDRISDPQKTGHASWWPTFNKIGKYLGEHTEGKERIMVIGHAARIYNKSYRESFYYLPSYVPFISRQAGAGEYEVFKAKIKKDYPEVIVLAGHMPAFPFNPKPYLEDMEEIQRQSAIVYNLKKVIDRFPIYFADIEKSYILALLRNRFANKKLEREKEKISEATRKFEETLKCEPREEAAVRFVENLKQEGRFEDVIYTVGIIGSEGNWQISQTQFERLFIALGETQYEMGRKADAEKTFGALLKRKPDSTEARNNLGVIYFSEGKILEAYEMFRAVLEQEPGHEQAKENIQLLQAQRTQLQHESGCRTSLFSN